MKNEEIEGYIVGWLEGYIEVAADNWRDEIDVATGHKDEIRLPEVVQVGVFFQSQVGKISETVPERLEPIRRLGHEPFQVSPIHCNPLGRSSCYGACPLKAGRAIDTEHSPEGVAHLVHDGAGDCLSCACPALEARASEPCWLGFHLPEVVGLQPDEAFWRVVPYFRECAYSVLRPGRLRC